MAVINLNRKIADGIKRVKIISVDEKYGPSGYPYLTFQLEVSRGPERGLTFSDRLSLSPQARFRVNQFLDAIAAPETGSADSADFVNKYAWADVAVEANEGYDPRPEVKKWLLPSDVDQGPEDDEDIAAEQASTEEFSQTTIAELAEDDDDPFNVPLTESNGKKKVKKGEKEEALA